MTTFAQLVAAGDPVDEELIDLLQDADITDPAAAHALGRAHWIAHFAKLEGFDFDFDEMLANEGLTWEQGASFPGFARDLFSEFEVGTRTLAVAQNLGAETFAELFTHPREVIMEHMATGSGLFDELVDVLERQGLRW